MHADLKRLKGGHGPRRSLRKPWKLGMRVQQLFVNNIDLQNAVFYEVRFGKIPVLNAHLTYRCTRFSW